MGKKYTIIMPAYNAALYIEEAIKSVLDQTYQNWELIIVDDGSQDATPVIVDSYASRDNRIIVIHQENSGTAAAARNRALEIASGDYSQMLDADDVISSDMLQKYEDILSKRKLDIVVPVAECFRDTGEIVWRKEPPDNDYKQEIAGIEAFRLSLDWILPGWFLVNMKLLKQIKYDPILINGDEFTTRKLFMNASKVGFSECIYRYRENLVSTTKKSSNEVRMYECLITDLNIYNYAIEYNVPRIVENECASKLAASVIHHMSKYHRRKIGYSETEKQKVEEIISTVFNSMSVDIWKKSKAKHFCIYLISLGSYKYFSIVIAVCTKLKMIIKGH